MVTPPLSCWWLVLRAKRQRTTAAVHFGGRPAFVHGQHPNAGIREQHRVFDLDPWPGGVPGERLIQHDKVRDIGRDTGITARVSGRPALVMELPLVLAEAVPGIS